MIAYMLTYFTVKYIIKEIENRVMIRKVGYM